MNEFFGYKCNSPSPLILVSGNLDIIYNHLNPFLHTHKFGVIAVFCEDKDRYKYDRVCADNNTYFMDNVDKLKNLLCRQTYLINKNAHINKKVLVIIDNNTEVDTFIQKSSEEFKDLMNNHRAYFMTCIVISNHAVNSYVKSDIIIKCNKTFEKKLLAYEKN